MNMIKDTATFWNPSQVPFMAADKSIYAVAKQIKWNWTDRNNEGKWNAYIPCCTRKQCSLARRLSVVQGNIYVSFLSVPKIMVTQSD
jgi:hypothetical protein